MLPVTSELPDVCYVCHETCCERSGCPCAAHVHEWCLLKSVVACKNQSCTICKGPFTNLRLLNLHQRTPVELNGSDAPVRELAFLCIASIFFSSLSLLFFAASTEQLERYAHLYALCCAASLSLAGSASRAFCQRSETVALRDEALVI